MGSYPPPPAKLPPGYLPLPRGMLGPSNPHPYPSFRQFDRGLGQFHQKWITSPEERAVQYGPPAKQIRPSPYPGDMFWPQGQFKPQKWVTQYAGPDQDFGAGCGCGGSNYGNPMFEGMSLGAKAAVAVLVAAAGLALIRRL